jgi:hypothetical protein
VGGAITNGRRYADGKRSGGQALLNIGPFDTWGAVAMAAFSKF